MEEKRWDNFPSLCIVCNFAFVPFYCSELPTIVPTSVVGLNELILFALYAGGVLPFVVLDNLPTWAFSL